MSIVNEKIDEIEILKSFYETIQYKVYHEFGPFLFSQRLEPLHNNMPYSVLQIIEKNKQDFLMFAKKRNDSTLDIHFEVSSPWHAYFLLQSLQLDYFVGKHSESRYRIYPDSEELTGSPLYFRGQDDLSYQFVTTLSRSDQKELSKAKVKVIEKYLTAFYERSGANYDIQFVKNASKSYAQHYGIATNLLDLTTDPAIAIYFANKTNAKQTRTGKVRSVCWHDLFFSSGKAPDIVLPPDFVRNLYVQRGLFYEADEDGKLVCSNPIDITFAKDDRFKVFRNRQVEEEVCKQPIAKEKDFLDIVDVIANNVLQGGNIEEMIEKYQFELMVIFKKLHKSHTNIPKKIDAALDWALRAAGACHYEPTFSRNANGGWDAQYEVFNAIPNIISLMTSNKNMFDKLFWSLLKNPKTQNKSPLANILVNYYNQAQMLGDDLDVKMAFKNLHKAFTFVDKISINPDLGTLCTRTIPDISFRPVISRLSPKIRYDHFDAMTRMMSYYECERESLGVFYRYRILEQKTENLHPQQLQYHARGNYSKTTTEIEIEYWQEHDLNELEDKKLRDK